MAIITFKIIQNAKVGGVLENLGYLLQDGDRDFLKIEEEMNEKMKRKVGKLVILPKNVNYTNILLIIMSPFVVQSAPLSLYDLNWYHVTFL